MYVALYFLWPAKAAAYIFPEAVLYNGRYIDLRMAV